MQTHADISYELARMRVEQARAEAARERLGNEARRAAPNFVPNSHRRDAAFWSVIIAPILGLGVLGYVAQEVLRSAA